MEQMLSSPSFPLLSVSSASIDALLPAHVQHPDDLERREAPTWEMLCAPLAEVLPEIPPLVSRGNRPIEFTFSDQVHSLVYFHAEEHTSARGLLEDLNDEKHPPLDGLPQAGVGRTTFCEAIHTRGLTQMLEVFERLSRKAAKVLGIHHEALGELRALDGSLIDATLSMAWADYTTKTHKAKVHLSFDLNRGIPRNLYLTEGKGAERPFVSPLLAPGETGVTDRGYQDHTRFDTWQDEDKFFVCRIRKNTHKLIVRALPIPPHSNIFFHAEVYLGNPHHRTRYTVRLIGLRLGRKILWIATNRTDLTALQIAFIYRLRWEIETFFAWWKRHLNVYHLIARSPHGLMMQLLAGLITYLLLTIYFYRRYDERPSLSRLRQLRRDIRDERGTHFPTTYSRHNQIILLFLTTNQYQRWKTHSIITAIR
jgi:hypothetical protein